MSKKLIWLAFILCVMAAEYARAAYVDVDYKANGYRYTVHTPEWSAVNRKSYDFSIKSPVYGEWHAACVKPFRRLEDDDRYKIWNGRMANPALLPKLRRALAGAKNGFEAHMIALEAYYETSDELDFANGSVTFPNVDFKINYAKPAEVQFLWHPKFQHLVLWRNVPEPGLVALLGLGLLFLGLAVRGKR